MLKKLIKYDLIWSMKVIIIFLSIGMGFAILGRLFSLIPDSFIFDIVSKICNGVALSMLISGVINSIIRSWVRFILTFYKDESYLTHTLPIDKNTHFLSKAISSIVTVAISCIVLFIGLIVMYYSKDTIKMLKDSLNIISSTLDSTVFGLLLVVVLVIVLEVLFILFCGYFGIVLGYSFNQNKVFKSVIFGIIVYLGSSSLSLIVMVISSLFNEGLKGLLFNGSGQLEFSLLVGLMWAAVIIYTIYCAIIYFVTNKLFNKGVNID